VVVMDGAYHGHTTATIDLSPYKFNGAGGTGRWVPSWTVAKYSVP
jgi:ethanolamine-phosphate phospho-lyase